MVASITEIEGVGPAYAKKLRKAGIRTCEGMLKAGKAKKGRKELAEASGFDEKTILEWVNRCDLMRIKGVGSEYSDLLEQSGVDTVKELRNRNAANLAAKMQEVNDATIKKTKKSIVRRVPTEVMVKKWVAHAKKLAPMVTH